MSVYTDPRIGTDLAGYRIEGLVGRGGMGVVYLAVQTRLERQVALKILAPELAHDTGFRERFERESHLAASIDHPNIIPIYEAGEAGGVLFIAMRYVEGVDLKARLDQEQRFEPESTLDILGQVAAALDAAHAKGLIHRDIKPGNIVIAAGIDAHGYDHVYLTDFGIAKHAARAGLTRTGHFLGTLDYAAPEQIEGRSLDGRADVYALGCVLYQCLTGRLPFERDNEAAVLYAHLVDSPPTATAARPELPSGLDPVIARAMAKDPENRYATARELVAAARAALTTAPLDAGAAAQPGRSFSARLHRLFRRGGAGAATGAAVPAADMAAPVSEVPVAAAATSSAATEGDAPPAGTVASVETVPGPAIQAAPPGTGAVAPPAPAPAKEAAGEVPRLAALATTPVTREVDTTASSGAVAEPTRLNEPVLTVGEPALVTELSESPTDPGAATSSLAALRRYGIYELRPWRVLAARIVSVAVFVAGVVYLTWRVGTIDDTGILGLTFYAVEVLNFALLVLTAVLFWRVRVRPGPPAQPAGELDVLITVCGEPVELVEESLRATLAIAYPHRTYLLNDGWIAGKQNWQDIEQLAARYDVPCFTRTDGTRGKAGNLNYALALTSGDYVAVIDCDHDASRSFAHELLGYFSDSRVGFVTTRQEFHGDRSDLLGTREPLFFSWFQPAKDAAGAAISTGSGVVYRRAALDSVEGFSEWSIVEDFHTSTRLHAKGWRSVYHPRPVTVGIAPRTAAALVKQRLTWATDSTRVLFYDNPLTRPGLSAWQRLHHSHTGIYYVVGWTQLMFLVSPALWLIWGIAVLRPPSPQSYLAYSIPAAAATFALLMIWGGQRGIRAIQQQFYLAPVFLIGVVRAATGVRFQSGVTDKVLQARFSPLMVPQVLIAGLLVASIVVAFLNPGDGQAVAVAWAAFMAYSLIAFISTASGNETLDRVLRIGLRAGIVILAALVILPLPDSLRPPTPAEAALNWDGPRLSVVAPTSGAYLGVYNPNVLEDTDGVQNWNETNGAQARVVHFYQEWFGAGDDDFPAERAALVADQGAVPMITWQPLGGASTSGANGASTILEDIASGRHDEYIRSWARTAAQYGRPVLIRPLHDMNGDWYPWALGGGTSSNTPQLFVDAWRHLHDLFAAEQATNVSWVWSVYSFEQVDRTELSRPYPGPEYVDWVAMAAFNWGEGNGNSWRTMDQLFGNTYDALSQLGKPVMISQIATTDDGGDPAAWTRDALRGLREDYPLVKAAVWYDARYSDDIDLRLRGATAEAFAAEVGSSSYWSPELATVEAPVPAETSVSTG